METQKKQSPPEPDPVTVPDSSSLNSKRNSGNHISLSSPVGSPLNSPVDSCSSPFHSKHSSEGHISLSPPAGSPGNSPPHSSLDSEHTTVNNSPENEKPYWPERGPRPEVVLSKDVFKEPTENRVVVEDPMAVVSRAVLEEPKAVLAKTDPVVDGGSGEGSGRRRSRPTLSKLRKAEREKMVRKAALGFRVFGLLFCLVSFSVMAVDRYQGWAFDSFNRYKEFRYCMTVNVIGFVYSGAQAFDLSYNLVTRKYIVRRQQLRYYLDFAVDQIIAYLLISASSSAAIRIDEWQLNWGKDKFLDTATASMSVSFLAFVALASSSLISGYALCTSKSI